MFAQLLTTNQEVAHDTNQVHINMENCIEYIGKFVRIISGKHEGEYAYVESTHDWAGGSVGVISCKENGDRFECMLSPDRVMLCETEEEISLAKDAAMLFLIFDNKAKHDWLESHPKFGYKEKLISLMDKRMKTLNELLNLKKLKSNEE